MIHATSARRAAVSTVTVLPRLVAATYKDAESDRKDRERREATLAHVPTRRDLLASHLCDLALGMASPALKVPARDALRQVIFNVVRGTIT